VIKFELWSEIDDDLVVSLAIICVDDAGGRDEVSVVLEILLIAVVPTSVSDEGVVTTMEVAYEYDVDDNGGYSLETNVSLIVAKVFSPVLLEIPDVAVEINRVVDSSDSLDKVRSFSELNRVVKIDVSDEIGSLFTVVADAAENEFVCSIV
jgi:hypothetical protein